MTNHFTRHWLHSYQVKLCALIAQSEFGDAPEINDSESRARFEQLPGVLSLDDHELLLSPTSGNASICVRSPTATVGIDYAATARVLPRELRDRLSGDRLLEIAREHGALRGRLRELTGGEARNHRHAQAMAPVRLRLFLRAGAFTSPAEHCEPAFSQRVDDDLYKYELCGMQQENSILSRNFLLGVNASGLHLVYSGDWRSKRAQRCVSGDESDERTLEAPRRRRRRTTSRSPTARSRSASPRQWWATRSRSSCDSRPRRTLSRSLSTRRRSSNSTCGRRRYTPVKDNCTVNF